MSRRALITGGAVRVGRAIALGLAREGYDLAIHYRSSDSAAHALQREIEGLGGRAHLFQGDLADPASIEVLAGAVLERFDHLDLLVNNASNFRRTPFDQIEVGEWDEVMAVNLRAPFLLSQRMAHRLRASKGQIINLLDTSAFQPWVQHPHHAVSKAGLLHLTKVMARALAPDIRVNAIAPGAVLLPEDYDVAERERSRNASLLKALGSPEDVLRAVLFLEASPFITGETIVVDGGRLQTG